MGEKHRRPTRTDRKLQQALEENKSLRAEVAESKETLDAFLSGAIDALVVDTPEGQRIFTLEGAEYSYRALIEQMREGAVSLTADGTIDYCNRGFADMLGRPLEQIMGTPARRYMAEADQPVFTALLRQGLSGSVRGELDFVTAEGRHLPAQVGLSLRLDSSPVPSVSMVVTDLTERKRAEHILASAQLARRLIDSAPIGVAVVGRDLRYILANGAYQAIAGDAAAAVVGRSIVEVLPAALADGVVPAVGRVLESGEGAAFREFEAAVRGQTWWNVTAVPLHDAEGETEAVLLLTEEVTQRKRAEEELKAAKLRAEQATAVAEMANKAKDHFMAVLGHELRNPLSPVMTIASLLRDDPRFDADTREQLEIIRRNADLAARLIDDLLDVTSIKRGKVELDRRPIDLRIIIRRAIDDCLADFKARQLEFEGDLGREPRRVDADAGRLQQVFWNLLKNAIKFTPNGGRVCVRCGVDQGFAVAVINDSGEGIEAGALVRIFNAFDQGDRSITRQFGGLGLGLTVSKAMVEMHGGNIEARSEGKGKGATFTVRLPLLPPEAADVAATQATALPRDTPRCSLRILLVEDHDDSAQIMRRLLAAEGHEICLAPDMATALRLAGEKIFELLVSDLGLPDGSGLDLLRALRAKGMTFPGISLSGYGQEENLRESREAGFAVHMVKPVSISRLKEEIVRVSRCGTAKC